MRRALFCALAIIVCMVTYVIGETEPVSPGAVSKTRTFILTYSASITDLPPGQKARVWFPVPTTEKDQHVTIKARALPADAQAARDAKYGNEIMYFESKPNNDGTIALEMTYLVSRHEVKADLETRVIDEERNAIYLQADSKVPVQGRVLDIIKDRQLPADQLAISRTLYDVVNNYMRYEKVGTGWGNGDSLWAVDKCYGNCSDFHSLFVSLVRSRGIPCKFEFGCQLPVEHSAGDASYHCWAKFKPNGHDWIPVDISEANKNPKMRDYYFGNLTENRVHFSTGRDIVLVPKQDGDPLNFFIYPYVEVAGKPLSSDKVKCKFSFSDVADQEKK